MQDLHDKAFVRSPGPGDYAAYKTRISRTVNDRNLFFVTKRMIISCMTIQDYDRFLAYRFELLRAWMKRARRQDVVFAILLRYLLKKLCLVGLLNAYEQNFLSSNENLVFAQDRSIKNLAVDFAKNPNEIVGFHYDNASIRQVLDGQQRLLIDYADIYFSNQRIVFSSTMHSFSIANKEITSAQVQNGSLRVAVSSGLVYEITSETPRVLLIAFNKMRR